MELVRKLDTRKNKKGKWIRFAIFKCPFDGKEVEMRISDGYKCKSCGCKRKELQSESKKGSKNPQFGKEGTNKGKVFTEGHCKAIAEASKGKIVSDKTRQKIGLSRKGKIQTDETRERISLANKGRILSKEQRQDISDKAKERYKNPENNPNWQGGISFEIYPKEFKQIKKFILERDNYKCQDPKCDGNHKRLHVHHIDYNKKNNNPENLVTLCSSCHAKTIGKNKRNYFIEYYLQIILSKECELIV